MNRISSIDGFRAISIALVIACHCIQRNASIQKLSAWGQMVENGGYQGVFIFFVISGYLITMLLLRDYDKSSRIHLARFYYRRFFRIVPPLYFYVAWVIATAALTGLRPAPIEVITALTFTRNLDFHSHQWFFSHFWSLCVEEQFYLLWPVCLLMVLKGKGRPGARSLAVALILIAPLFRLAVFVLVKNQPMRAFVYTMLPSQMDGLMFGCLAALAEGEPQWEHIYRRAERYIWAAPFWFFLVSNYLRILLGAGYQRTIAPTLDGLCVVLALIWCIRNPMCGVGRALNWRPIVHIGVISYSIYLWQTWFLHSDNPSRLASPPWSLAYIFLAAEFSWHGIERLSRIARDRLEPLLFNTRLSSVPSENRSAPEEPPKTATA